jgi:hypothetical protein
LVSKTCKVGKPLIIFTGVHQMTSWLPEVITEPFESVASHTRLAERWILDHFSSPEDKWSLLLLD